MWTAEDVRHRFVEAAEIERRMYVKGLSGGGNAWPSYRFDEDDMKGWDDAAKLDHLEQWQGRKVTKSAEITLWEECFYLWTLQYIVQPSDRRRVWIWARCVACGPSFVSVCEKNGWVRRTEYARLERTFILLAETLCNKMWTLKEAGNTTACTKTESHRMQSAAVRDSARANSPRIHPPFRTEPHRDMLGSPEAVQAFSKHLAETNEARRKARLRKALRGVPDEVEAAA